MSGPRFAFVPAKWIQPDSPLDSSARLVLCVICQYVGKETFQAWPSVATIGACSRLSRRTVQRCLKDLERAGAVIVKRRREGAINDSNLYTVIGYDPVGVVQPLHGGSATIAPPSANNDRGVVQPLRPNTVNYNLTTSTATAEPTVQFLDGASNADAVRLLDGLPAGVVRVSWAAEISAARQGMHGPPLTDEQVARACRDYAGNGHLSGTPTLRHFRAFLKSAGRPEKLGAATPAGTRIERGLEVLRNYVKESEAKNGKL